MNALAIIAISVGGVFGYCGTAVYVYLRLLWYFTQKGGYGDHAGAAGACALFLPVGLMVLAMHSLGSVDSNGLAPRSVRREREIKRQREEIARLERELELR